MTENNTEDYLLWREQKLLFPPDTSYQQYLKETEQNNGGKENPSQAGTQERGGESAV